MKLIAPSYEILTQIGVEMLQQIERAARTCYKSEDKITVDSAEAMVRRLIASGHEAMIEHALMSVRFICDRGVSHELVRHRIASFAQESTRYCNYSKDKFGNELTFIAPPFFEDDGGAIRSDEEIAWRRALEQSERSYFDLLKLGWTPQQARSVLPNSLKTEIIVTANMREWRLIFKLRAAPAAHPQMRELMSPLLHEMQSRLPALFEDIDL